MAAVHSFGSATFHFFRLATHRFPWRDLCEGKDGYLEVIAGQNISKHRFIMIYHLSRKISVEISTTNHRELAIT